MSPTTQDLYSYYSLLFPSELEKDEYVRIIAFKKIQNGERIPYVNFVKSYEEYENTIKRYSHGYDVFNSLSTVRGNELGDSNVQLRRQVICLDFDAKDFPDHIDAKSILMQIKKSLPRLYNHAVVLSGSGGLHLYIAVVPCTDTNRIIDITKRLSQILGADPKTCIPTQVMRVPMTFNQKHDPPKKVISLRNEVNNPSFRRYSLLQLEKIIDDFDEEKKAQPIELREIEPTYTETQKPTVKQYPCVVTMLDVGVSKGFRNVALGRITKYLDLQGYSKSAALKVVLDWNQRCTPPKSEREVMGDFGRYWETDYRLLGCQATDDPKAQELISLFCDRSLCSTQAMMSQANNIAWDPATLRRNEIKNAVLRKLNGNQYLLLTLLRREDRWLTTKELAKLITGRRTGKPCISDKRMRENLRLMENKFVEYNKNLHAWRILNKYKNGTDIVFSYAAAVLLINGDITPAEFRVYLCMVRNLRDNTCVTYERLADDLDTDSRNIGREISGLEKGHVIRREKILLENGRWAYRYYMMV